MPWDESFLVRCATTLTKIEHKLTNVQIGYLCRYYRMNNDPENEEFAKQWNRDDIIWFWDLDQWCFCRRIADDQVAYQQQPTRIAAA
ncbi:unnamed protein product [Rotaria magnacalcarata]|uniref:Uncharacterized protein n=1 Tax=Rotaria magnacalcarata TaxID=392030 RepID=A0A819LJV7_9BILA|nr:unnamed protein product [Rotaria magnacalcarata]